MDEKLKILWNLDVLVKMSRSKSDGPSLRVEENELLEKIDNYDQEIDEISQISDDDIYDTSAEMADRNIEIITKKQLQRLKADLKETNKELNKLKQEEGSLYEETSLLRENKASNEKYIQSMQERLSENTDRDVLDRYNSLIAETAEKIESINVELKDGSQNYEDVQNQIIETTNKVEELEDRIDKKKKLLAETQANLTNKENYVDRTKKEKNIKKIEELNEKIAKLNARIDEIHKDPKYIETKVKEIINDKEDNAECRDYLIELINQVIKIPYINVPTDNVLEEELLRATQARDSFANEIDQKSYNILEAETPEKVRTDFLTKRIENWKEELKTLQAKIDKVDKDSQYSYEANDRLLSNMISVMKNDLNEFQKAYDETPETSIASKASIGAALEEKKQDIVEAEKIANAFRTDEAEDIATATRTIKYQCEQLNTSIQNAEEEIKRIRTRLLSKKSGLIDITTRNKDKDVLKELAQTVIDIKHRRQFPDTPLEVVERLEEQLGISLKDGIDLDLINNTSHIEGKDYDEMINKDKFEVVSPLEDDGEIPPFPERKKRGLKVISEAEIDENNELLDDDDNDVIAETNIQSINSEEPEEEETPKEEVKEEPVAEAPIEEAQEAIEPPTPPMVDAPVPEQPVEEQPMSEPPVEELAVEAPVEEAPPVETPPVEIMEAPVEEQPIVELTPTEVAPQEIPAEPVVELEPTPVEAPQLTPIEPQPAPVPEAPIESIAPTEPMAPVPPVEEPVAEAPVAEPVAPTPVEEQPIVELTPTEPTPTDFGDLIANVGETAPVPEQPAEITPAQGPMVELAPSNGINQDLSINNIFGENNSQNASNNDNIVSSDALSNDLDEFINSLADDDDDDDI